MLALISIFLRSWQISLISLQEFGQWNSEDASEDASPLAILWPLFCKCQLLSSVDKSISFSSQHPRGISLVSLENLQETGSADKARYGEGWHHYHLSIRLWTTIS